MSTVVESLQAQHLLVRAGLARCADRSGEALAAELRSLHPLVQGLFEREEALYAELHAACAQRKDSGTGALARIFEGNLKVTAAGVRGFFAQLQAIALDAPQLERRAQTLATVLTSQMDAEATAVIPLHARVTRT